MPAAVGIAYIAGLVGIAFLLTGLGIVIPKRIAAKSPIRFCYKVLPLVELVTKCLFPYFVHYTIYFHARQGIIPPYHFSRYSTRVLHARALQRQTAIM